MVDESETAYSLSHFVSHSLVSMIDGVLFDKLEWIGRKVRGNEKPFGGLQVSLNTQRCWRQAD